MKNRLQSLDIFRGITICFMIIVNTPGSYTLAFAPLQHAAWHGFTPTDLVFPSFVFITGLSAWFSFKSVHHTLTPALAMKIWKRAGIIFLLGVGLYAFPFVGHPLSTWRILGVLQRIALCYAVGSTVALLVGTRYIPFIIAALLLGYWGIVSSFGDLTMAGNAGQKLDMFLFGESHLYHGEGIAFDPEGFLSTMPSLGTFFIGYLVGNFLDQNQDKTLIIRNLSIAGISLIIVGLLWDFNFPINKKLWTSSYVCLAGGLSTIIFTLCYYLIDVKKIQNWSRFFKVFGTNAILAYMVSELLIICISLFQSPDSKGVMQDGHWWTHKTLFISWLGDTEGASFIYAIVYMLVCWAIVWLFYRKSVFLKVG